MKDEYLFLWAQWGVLNCDRHKALINKFGNLQRAWNAANLEILRGLGVTNDTARNLLEAKSKISFEQIMDVVQQFQIKLLYVEDSDYPENLKNISKPPPFLFVRGKLPSFHKSLAIVGTRAHSDYGRNITERFTADLAREGFVIVSGLALGIDSIAHRATVECNGTTVAVLGSGVDKIYPSSNHRLADDILRSGGAIVSVFPLGTPALPHHFPQRNVIVAGLTLGTLVTEGGVKSGALITAREALNEGRGVFAIPCNVAKLVLSGTNQYIRESKAKLVENIDHILEEFRMQGTLMKQEQEFTDDERFILERLGCDGKSMDQLFDETTYDIPQLANILVGLQLKSVVNQEYNRWVLA